VWGGAGHVLYCICICIYASACSRFLTLDGERKIQDESVVFVAAGSRVMGFNHPSFLTLHTHAKTHKHSRTGCLSYIPIYLQTYTHTHTYTHTQTYTHTHTHSFRHDDRPIDPTCHCEACRTHSRSYIHHLLKVRVHRAVHMRMYVYMHTCMGEWMDRSGDMSGCGVGVSSLIPSFSPPSPQHPQTNTHTPSLSLTHTRHYLQNHHNQHNKRPASCWADRSSPSTTSIL
jgi:hypothetical protein